MQMDEETELAFKAGAEWVLENSYCDGLGEIELDRKIIDGYIEYINGNFKPNKS